MRANDYQRVMQMKNQNSFSQFPYNGQQNHTQNVTSTAIDVLIFLFIFIVTNI